MIRSRRISLLPTALWKFSTPVALSLACRYIDGSPVWTVTYRQSVRLESLTSGSVGPPTNPYGFSDTRVIWSNFEVFFGRVVLFRIEPLRLEADGLAGPHGEIGRQGDDRVGHGHAGVAAGLVLRAGWRMHQAQCSSSSA